VRGTQIITFSSANDRASAWLELAPGRYVLVCNRSVPEAVAKGELRPYGDRYRHDEAISTAFVEATVNYVVSKRFVKKQQMRWTQRGAHLLLETRVQVLNDDLRKTFGRWFPGMRAEEKTAQKEAA
jgi:hypothetical protein